MSNKHLKVLLLAEYDRVGGTRTYAKQLIAFYARNKFDLAVVAKGPINDEEMVHYCQSYGVRFLRYEEVADGSVEFSGKPWHFAKERRLLDRFIGGLCPSIIVASVGTPGLYLGHMGRGRRSIYILHTYPLPPKVYWRHLVNKMLWGIMAPKDVNFLTVSQFSRARTLETWGLWRSRSDIAVIHSCAGEIVDAESMNDDCIRVLTVGHVVDYKNPMMLIKAAAKAITMQPALRFIWVGPGPLIESCRNKVADLGLQDKVVFVGESGDMCKYYQKCEIYIQPSKIESLGLSVLDAMRYGKPCVVTNVGGLPELVSAGETGLVVGDEDENDMVQCILKLANDESVRREMGRASQARYARHFSFDRWEREMLRMHNRILLGEC